MEEEKKPKLLQLGQLIRLLLVMLPTIQKHDRWSQRGLETSVPLPVSWGIVQGGLLQYWEQMKQWKPLLLSCFLRKKAKHVMMLEQGSRRHAGKHRQS